MAHNVWLPGNDYYDFNDGVVSEVKYGNTTSGNMLCQSFTIPNAQAGFGITFDMVTPNFNITKPPVIRYSSTSAMVLVLKDSDNWLWTAPCPAQDLLIERGWSWSRFILHSVQENTGEPPTAPASGSIKSFQISGASGVHGSNNDESQTIEIAYIAGKSPEVTSVGNIRKFVITDTYSGAHTLKIGNVELIGGSRKEIKYLGALPFGLQMNGPKNRLSPLPYRGPLVAGYQSGTPWIYLNDNAKLTKLLEFMSDAQVQFNERSPDNIMGPWMHIYLPALWDCEQNGAIDSWVWDGPDGNPAWDGWQYRAIDAMGHTWYLANESTTINSTNKALLTTICTRFLDWLYQWLVDHPTAVGVPNDWKPAGWNQGTPLSPDRCLEPKQTNYPSSHDNCLALKGAVFSTLAGYDQTKGKFIIHKCIQFLKPVQVADASDMRGAFTLNPAGWEVYGFEQGEILDALALCKQHPELLQE